MIFYKSSSLVHTINQLETEKREYGDIAYFLSRLVKLLQLSRIDKLSSLIDIINQLEKEKNPEALKIIREETRQLFESNRLFLSQLVRIINDNELSIRTGGKEELKKIREALEIFYQSHPHL